MDSRKKSEQRKHPRVRARHIAAQLTSANRAGPCFLEDISEGGVFLQTPDILPVGMPVSVRLGLPGEDGVLVTGRVVWALAPLTATRKKATAGMRIRFDALPDAPRERLRGLVEELQLRAREAAVKLSSVPVKASAVVAPVPAEADAPRLWVQVQGLLMQIGELQQALEARERELEAIRVLYESTRSQLQASERERKATELALRKLSLGSGER